MRSDYLFREITKNEVHRMFQFILDRMKWMDDNGIRQWNKMNYDVVYPQAYYEEKRQNGEVFVLVDVRKNEMVCAAVLIEQDERWTDREPSIYLHNFVTSVGEHGVGGIFLQFAEEYAGKKGKKFLRLDSARDNHSLAQYYKAHGFLPFGLCEEGAYEGILWQKEVSR